MANVAGRIQGARENAEEQIMILAVKLDAVVKL